MLQGLDNFIGAVGDAIKTAPTFYEDAIQPTVQETGKVLALIPQTIEAALLPLRKWNIEREYKFTETKKLLEHKLKNIDPEKIVTPEAYVAVPAIQAISYSMDSEELRNLYANLLAKAMNSDTKDLVHPSFVEIIKQMSPIDARIFTTIMESPIYPLISIMIQTKNGGGQRPFEEYCSWITEFSLKKSRASFNSLTRLGLIEIPDIRSYTNKKNYNSVRQNPLFIEAETTCLSAIGENEEISYLELYIKINELSKLFYKVCVQNS